MLGTSTTLDGGGPTRLAPWNPVLAVPAARPSMLRRRMASRRCELLGLFDRAPRREHSLGKRREA